MWSAVFQLNVHFPKSTIHNLLCANQKTTTNTFIHSLRDRSWPNLKEVIMKIKDKDMIVIDDVSMTITSLLVGMDNIFRQSFEKYKPFGGKNMILLGDFCQIPPNNETLLANILASYQSGSQKMFRGDDSQSVIYLQAAKIFMKFQRFVLKQQMRAAEDPVHCALIERFSLKNKNPPITQDVINNFHCLTPELIKEYPSFKNAS